jgi:hypothetical protein
LLEGSSETFSSQRRFRQQMRWPVIAVAASLVAIMAVIAFTGILNPIVQTGFNAEDLVEPRLEIIPRSTGHAPSPSTNVRQQASWGITWETPEDSVYAGFGGVLWLTLNSQDSKDIWVYGVSFIWVENSAMYSKETGVLAAAGEDTLVGLLPFGAPLEPGSHQYRIAVEMAVQSISGPWYDCGNVVVAEGYYFNVRATPASNGWSTTMNPTNYYDKVNSRIDEASVGNVLTSVEAVYPGQYNLLQVCQAYEWVRTNVAYVAETGDYWQSANETLNSLSGDCEDHAILIASIIKGLGGNARVNIIDGHAFSTVFVASNSSELQAVEESIESYYWAPSGSLRINYLIDDFGYWMVMDTTGEPYVGGLPTLSRYASWVPDSATFTFSDSNYLICIDATGEQATKPFLF